MHKDNVYLEKEQAWSWMWINNVWQWKLIYFSILKQTAGTQKFRKINLMLLYVLYSFTWHRQKMYRTFSCGYGMHRHGYQFYHVYLLYVWSFFGCGLYTTPVKVKVEEKNTNWWKVRIRNGGMLENTLKYSCY